MEILYSINTWLSFKIGENFYSNIHYVWCTPHFNAKGINPPSSDPYEICHGLIKDIDGHDKHSAKILLNKSGILAGADKQLANGVISNSERLDIIEIVKLAEVELFRPLIFVIPFDGVINIAKKADIRLTAGLFSKEYIIDKLPREKFDIIDIYKNNEHV